MTNVRIDIKNLTNLQNIIRTPGNIHHSTKLRDQMHTTFNLRNGDDRSTTAMASSGSWDLVHLKIGDWGVERCEPFDVGERVLEIAVLGGQGENDPYLANSQTYVKVLD
jgi:hypothetical protein